MRSRETFAIAIDAGGTYFKSAVIDLKGIPVAETVRKTPVDLNGNAEAVLLGYENIIREGKDFIRMQGGELGGIGVSTPGPFEYDQYTSRMTHKFKSIYGINIKEALVQVKGVIEPSTPMKFLHDVHAFILGEHWQGAARGYSSVVAVTIGTGIGFGCILENRIKDNGQGGPYISLFRRPFEGGTLEDQVSRRGIIAHYCKLSGISEDSGIDAKEIGILAETGRDVNAVITYRRAGRILAESVYEIVKDLNIECLVLGGQIARSFCVMEQDIKDVFKDVPGLKKISMGEHIDHSPLIGAARAVFESSGRKMV